MSPAKRRPDADPLGKLLQEHGVSLVGVLVVAGGLAVLGVVAAGVGSAFFSPPGSAAGRGRSSSRCVCSC